MIFGLFVSNLTPCCKYAKYEQVLDVVEGQNVTVLEACFVPILYDFSAKSNALKVLFACFCMKKSCELAAKVMDIERQTH